mmetsp:Transcript_13015/g.23403  ORF Transcript_13015/g.23403 Transcript_13015/m.23403 type:complete len:502 (-) Transcript_13015:2004-3509(-)
MGSKKHKGSKRSERRGLDDYEVEDTSRSTNFFLWIALVGLSGLVAVILLRYSKMLRHIANSVSQFESNFVATSGQSPSDQSFSSTSYFGFDEVWRIQEQPKNTQASTASSIIVATAADSIQPEGYSCDIWKRDLLVSHSLPDEEATDYRFLLAPNAVGDIGRDLIHLNLVINMCLLYNLTLVLPPTHRAHCGLFLDLSSLGIPEATARKLITEHRVDDRDSSVPSTTKITMSIDSISAAAKQLPRASMIEVLLSPTTGQHSPMQMAAFARFARDTSFSGPLLRGAHYLHLKEHPRTEVPVQNRLSTSNINLAVYLPEIDDNNTAVLKMVATVIETIVPLVRQEVQPLLPEHGTDETREDGIMSTDIHVLLVTRRKSSDADAGEARLKSALIPLLHSDIAMTFVNMKMAGAVGVREMLRADILLASPSSAASYFAASMTRNINLIYAAQTMDQLGSLADSLNSLAVSSEGAFDSNRFSFLLRVLLRCRAPFLLSHNKITASQ